MAYEATNQEDEQKVQQGFGTQANQVTNQTTQAENAPTLGGQQSTLIGQDVSATQNQVNQGQSNTAAGQKSSGMGARVSNLKKYIEANRGAGMAQKIQSGVEKTRTGIEGDIGTAESALNTQAEAEKARLSKGEQLIKSSNEGGQGLFERGKTEAFANEPIKNTLITNTNDSHLITPTELSGGRYIDKTDGTVRNADGSPYTPQQLKTTPDFSQYGQTAADRLAAFNKYKAGETQQLNIENQADLQKKVKDLQTTTGLAGSEEGRFQLLKDTFKKPSYTTGQQRLDQLILQANPEEKQTLLDMQKNVANPVQERLAALMGKKETEAADIASKASSLATNIGTGLTGAETGFQTEIEQQRQAAVDAALKRQQQIQADLNAGKISDTGYLADLGLTQDQYNRLSQVAPLIGGMGQFLTKTDPTAITRSQAAKDEDFARQQALSILQDKYSNFLNQSEQGQNLSDFTNLNYAQAKSKAAQQRDAEVQKVNDYYNWDNPSYNTWASFTPWNTFNNLWNSGQLLNDSPDFDLNAARANASASNSIAKQWMDYKRNKEAAALNQKYSPLLGG